MSHDYSVFGLRIRSERELPELRQAQGDGDPDVTIRFGTIDADVRAAGLHALAGDLLFVAPDAARYRIAGGTDILVEPNHGAPDRNVRLYLLGSAFGTILHQRGLLPLHANAIEIGGRAVAFLGKQGEGKSTLAAWFHDQGHRIIADDVCVVRFDASGPAALPGLPRLRLWEDAVAQTGRASEGLSRSYAGDDNWNKFDLPIAQEQAVSGPLPLAAIYVLESGDAFAVRRLDGIAAAEALFDHTYRGSYLDAAGSREAHWQAAIGLVRTVPLFRLVRERGFETFDRQAAHILDHATGVAKAVAPS